MHVRTHALMHARTSTPTHPDAEEKLLPSASSSADRKMLAVFRSRERQKIKKKKDSGPSSSDNKLINTGPRQQNDDGLGASRIEEGQEESTQTAASETASETNNLGGSLSKRSKKDNLDFQVHSTVDKINKTATGKLLIILSKENTDKGQGLQKTIAYLLKKYATVISKSPQEDLEIRILDDTTTKEEILAAL
ncbi:hypothetical protein EVAR_57207_1 [Eumeta japonica]|uniref:Uncharacterized protein n=1 Tax=Eumeta variegata TaxID=151549 RepID=A0A4C1YLF3_EUMVA|nr:hypothetical protein EVAR_57207_1 [Eumeta japonica]